MDDLGVGSNLLSGKEPLDILCIFKQLLPSVREEEGGGLGGSAECG